LPGGDRLSCHGKVYEDECRVASCKYHLAKRKGMAHRWVTGRMLMQTILPLSSQDWIFFFFLLVLFIVFLVLKSRGARPPEGGAAVMNDTCTKFRHTHN